VPLEDGLVDARGFDAECSAAMLPIWWFPIARPDRWSRDHL